MKTAKANGLLLALWSACAAAGDPARPDTAAPSVELLEFLGEWQTAKGEWIDPLQLQDVEASTNDAGADGKAKAQGDKGERHD